MSPYDTLLSFIIAANDGTTLAWCVEHPNPVATLDEAWVSCDSEGLLREFLSDVVGDDTWPSIRCGDFEMSCPRSGCKDCVRALRVAYPVVGHLAIRS